MKTLMKFDKDTTFKVAQRLGLMGRDGESLAEQLLGVIKNSGDKTTNHFYLGDLHESDRNKLTDNIKAFYTEKPNRF